MKYLYIFSLITIIFSSCSRNNSVTDNPALDNVDFSDSFVYDKNSKFVSSLARCVNVETMSDSCTLNELPFLAQESSTPTKEMIMQRVVVSHQWMGERFAEMLDILDDDIKILLGGVTAIVIDDDIRPSFYWSLTGAMYIDPRYLWLSREEADTITIQDDYRSDFANELAFIETSRFVIDGEWVSPFITIESNRTRDMEDITYNLASLLYHELAHANDFFPPSMRASVDNSKSVYDTLSSLYSDRITNELYDKYPLSSTELWDMGQVMYQGYSPTTSQKLTTAEQMGELFEADNALDMYAYSSHYEDIATLFQMAMLKYHYNIEQDIAFIIEPTKTEDLYCDDYIVGWGERNSVSKDIVKQIAIFVTQKLLGDDKDWSSIYDNTLGTASLLRDGVDWCRSIDIIAPTNKIYNTNIPINRDNLYLKRLL